MPILYALGRTVVRMINVSIKQTGDHRIAEVPLDLNLLLSLDELLQIISSDYGYYISDKSPRKHEQDLPLRSRLWESSITRLPDVARRVAMSRAASKRRSCKKPLFARMASPINSALWASPFARTIMDCRQSLIRGFDVNGR